MKVRTRDTQQAAFSPSPHHRDQTLSWRLGDRPRGAQCPEVCGAVGRTRLLKAVQRGHEDDPQGTAAASKVTPSGSTPLRNVPRTTAAHLPPRDPFQPSERRTAITCTEPQTACSAALG